MIRSVQIAAKATTLFLTMALVLSACGSDDSKEQEAPQSSDTQTTALPEKEASVENPELEQRLQYKAENEAFAEEWRTQDGVTVLPSGAAYRIVTEGTGDLAQAEDVATVRYKGSLIDGTVFDQTEGEETASFPVNGVIKGWSDILQQMKEGSSVEMMIPADQAYGGDERGAIKAFSTLLFTVDLISAKSQEDFKTDLEAPGKAYLEENGQKEGVITTDSGLQYKILQQGEGPTPGEKDMVRIQFEVKNIDGAVIDSSYGQPQVPMLPISGSLPGWQEALMLMNVGSKYEVTLPHELAFGARRLREDVPPYSTLIFTFEMLGIFSEAKEIAYLEENRQKEGWSTRDSGLQYKVITEGTGEKPIRTSKVKVHYEGRLIDGTKFDSSYDRGEPAIFPVSGVIEGWTEALRLMPAGSKYELVIPAKLGYGPQGSANIPPNATLLFTVELLEVYN